MSLAWMTPPKTAETSSAVPAAAISLPMMRPAAGASSATPLPPPPSRLSRIVRPVAPPPATASAAPVPAISSCSTTTPDTFPVSVRPVPIAWITERTIWMSRPPSSVSPGPSSVQPINVTSAAPRSVMPPRRVRFCSVTPVAWSMTTGASMMAGAPGEPWMSTP